MDLVYFHVELVGVRDQTECMGLHGWENVNWKQFQTLRDNQLRWRWVWSALSPVICQNINQLVYNLFSNLLWSFLIQSRNFLLQKVMWVVFHYGWLEVLIQRLYCLESQIEKSQSPLTVQIRVEHSDLNIDNLALSNCFIVSKLESKGLVCIDGWKFEVNCFFDAEASEVLGDRESFGASYLDFDISSRVPLNAPKELVIKLVRVLNIPRGKVVKITSRLLDHLTNWSQVHRWQWLRKTLVDIEANAVLDAVDAQSIVEVMLRGMLEHRLLIFGIVNLFLIPRHQGSYSPRSLRCSED